MADPDLVEQEDNSVVADWHPADIQAALKKRGLTLAGLSVAHGYHATAAGKALKRSWPALEIIIAAAIGIAPREVWPSRYNAGKPVPTRRGRTVSRS
jgi:Ner family transcriptional regulator